MWFYPIGRYDIVKHADLCFFQMFLWERFPMIAHKLMDFSMGTMEEVMFPMALEGQDPQTPTALILKLDQCQTSLE